MRMELLVHTKPSSPDPLHQEVTFKRPLSYTKMESLVKEMQDPEHGVPVRSQKLFLTSIPAAFAGYDIIEWLMERLSIEDSVEAIHLANLLCQHGYFFPVGDNRQFSVKDDSSLYRFQTPYYWPSQYPLMDSVDYAIYLAKRTLRNKQKHGLDDYEMEALNQLRKNLNQKWDFISMQADEQVRISKERKKVDKLVTDAQERAFWRVLRPPPGSSCCVETPPMHKHDFHAKEGIKQIRRTNLIEDLRAEVDLLRTSCIRTRIKVSQALESLANHCESYNEHDPFLVVRQPSNPWISDDPCYWIINAPLIEIPTERRVKKWATSMEDLVLDPTGLREITTYLKKEYCHENIRFWLAVRDLRYGPVSQLRGKAQAIYNEFLSPGAPCEINIDMRTMEAVQKELNYLTPCRFTFDPAAEHVYTLLLKKDCYPRFIRSDQYKTLLANALQPINQKKRLDKFLSYLALGKKKQMAATPPIYPVGGVLQIPPANMGMGEMFKAADEAIMMATGNKSDLMSASSLDTDKLSVMADCPYRGDLAADDRSRDIDSVINTLSQGSFDDVCPWESMEKLPDKDKSGSQSQSVASSAPAKPSTSAAALASQPPSGPVVSSDISVSSSSSHQTKPPTTSDSDMKSSSTPTTSSATGIPRQESILSKQASITSTKGSTGQGSPLLGQSSVASNASVPSAEVSTTAPPVASPVAGTSQSDNQLPPPLQPTAAVAEVAVTTAPAHPSGGNSSIISSLDSSSTASKESVIHASPSISTSSKDPPAPPTSTISDVLPTVAPVSSQMDKTDSNPIPDNQPLPQEPCTSSSITHMPLPSTSPTATISTSPPQYPGLPPLEGEELGDENEGKEICPWDHENGTRPESITFVKTYSTLGYL